MRVQWKRTESNTSYFSSHNDSAFKWRAEHWNGCKNAANPSNQGLFQDNGIWLLWTSSDHLTSVHQHFQGWGACPWVAVRQHPCPLGCWQWKPCLADPFFIPLRQGVCIIFSLLFNCYSVSVFLIELPFFFCNTKMKLQVQNNRIH